MYFRTILILLLFFTLSQRISFGGEPEFMLTPSPATCHGKSDGKLVVRVLNLDTIYTLRVIKESLQDTLLREVASGSELELQNLGTGKVKLDLLSEGKVILCSDVLISEPSPLEGNRIQLVRAPSTESACDGILLAEPSGGTPPYSFHWSENAGSSEKPKVENICMGIYRCEINDSNNCGPVYISIPVLKNTMKKAVDPN